LDWDLDLSTPPPSDIEPLRDQLLDQAESLDEALSDLEDIESMAPCPLPLRPLPELRTTAPQRWLQLLDGERHPLIAEEGFAWFPLDAPPGALAYRLCWTQEGDDCVLDPKNPLKGLLRGSDAPWSLLEIPDRTSALLRFESVEEEPEGRLSLNLLAWAGTAAPQIELQPQLEWDEQPLEEGWSWYPCAGRLSLELEGFSEGHHRLKIKLLDLEGRSRAALNLPFWLKTPFKPQEAVIYALMVDRFAPLISSSRGASLDDYMGGGYLEIIPHLRTLKELGVNIIALNPITQNAEGGYHGFWPVGTACPYLLNDSECLEERLGSLEELRSFVKAAQAFKMRVLVDLVADRIHKEAAWSMLPLVGPQVDGEFYLLESKHYEILALLRAHADWLLREAGIDGFRLTHSVKEVDPLIPALRAQLEASSPSSPPLLLGGSHILRESPLEPPPDLDLYWDTSGYLSIVRSLLLEDRPLSQLAQLEADPERLVFLGNHDFSRPLSLAESQAEFALIEGQDADRAGAGRLMFSSEELLPFQKLRLAWLSLISRPGPLMIYYGDELGMAGLGRPSNRAPRNLSLTAGQRQLRNDIRGLLQLRASEPLMRGGHRRWIRLSEPEWAAWSLEAPGEEALLIVLRRGEEGPGELLIPSPWPQGSLVQELLDQDDSLFEIGADRQLFLQLPPYGAALFRSL